MATDIIARAMAINNGGQIVGDDISDDFNDLKQQFLDHANNDDVHVIAEEKKSWNEKVSVSANETTECLVFYK